jgi:protoheme IX farnesyltransferase
MSSQISTASSQNAESSPESRSNLALYFELSKARLGALVVLTAFVGYVLGSRYGFSIWGASAVVIGTALSSFGANILNQWWEVEQDRRMVRTSDRPLPAGRVSRRQALIWGLATAVIGLAILAAGTNWLTTGLSLFVILLYVLVYTPLKIRTPLNTVVGAVCGAIPPMMGWAAATGQLDAGAWILGGILFIWQIPHFLALAWLYRDDYDRGGFRMLPAVDNDGRLTSGFAFLYAAALLPVTAALTATGVTGGIYLVASQLAGVAFLVLGWFFVRERNRHAARRLFLASILYLPIIMGLMVSDMNHRFTVHFELQSASRPAGDPPASQVSTSPAAYEEGL